MDLKEKRSECPFSINFKWSNTRHGYVRGVANYRHSHELIITKMGYFVRNRAVIKELKLYAECDILPAHVHSLINARFKISASYAEVYGAYKNVKKALNKMLDYN